MLHKPSNSTMNCVTAQSCAEGSETAAEGELFLQKNPVIKQPIYQKATHKILSLQS